MQGRIGIATIMIVVALCWVTIGTASWVPFGPTPENGAEISLLTTDAVHTTYEVRLHGLQTETVDVLGTSCIELSIPGTPMIMERGFPELPMIRQALVIPDQGNVVVEVVEIETRDILIDVVKPSKGHINRNIDPATVPYTFDNAYQQDAWFPADVITHDDPFIIRDVRGTVVQVNAVRVNPAQHMIRVVTRVVLDVRTDGAGGVNAIDRTEPLTYVDREFHNIYQRMFLNYNALDYVPIYEPGRMFIITDPLYVTAIDDFYQWKLQKGIPTELYTLDQTGYNSSQIYSFIQNAYNSPEGLTYIVLVGDIDDVPTLYGVVEGAESDPCYTKLAGSDNYPDAFSSRISATSASTVEYQAYKFLRYEKLPDTGVAGDWYHKGTGIGGDDTGGTGLADWERCELLRTVLLSYTYTEIDQIYHSSATASQVTNALNQGRSIINYIGHGSTTAWGTTGFSNSNVHALSNGWMQPYIIDVACVNGDFSYGECFAEAWLRAGDMINPKGAIGMYASSTNMSWVPPCDMQTHCVDLLCTEAKNSYGGICFQGSMYCMDVWGAGNSDEGTKVFEQTNIFGDCNMQVRSDTPTPMTVNHSSVLFLEMNTFDVHVPGLENALACLYADGVQYGMAYTDVSGNAQIVMDSPPSSPMTVTLTVSAYNKDTYIADIPVIPMSGPYLSCDSLVVTDVTNPNGMVEYGENVLLSVWLLNQGNSDALNTEATLISTDQYVTIIDDFESYGTIAQGTSVGRTDAFELYVHGNVPDGHFLALTLLVSCDDIREEWGIPLSITAHSAAFTISGFVIDDASGNGNGMLEAGETADITLSLDNDGSATTSNLVAQLTSDSPYLTINSGTSSHGGIGPSGSGTFTPDYQVSVSSGCPNFTPAVFYLEVLGSRDLESHLMKAVTLCGFQEAVENGQGSWTHAVQTPGFYDQWHISTMRSNSPTHSWKCGATGTGTYLNLLDATLATPSLTVPDGCQLTFWHWMDAEASGYYPDSAYDGGIVEISAGGGPWTQITPQGGYTHYIRYSAGGSNPYTGPFDSGIPCYSGVFNWTQATFDLTGYSGNVQIRFRFGSDAATTMEGWYIDDIEVNVGSSMVAPVNLAASISGSEVTLTWNSPGVNPAMSLLSYNIYRNSVKIDSMFQGLEYTDNLAQLPFGTYLYQVSAEYDAGESSLTPPESVVYSGGLQPVEDLVISVVGNHVTLNWSPAGGATGYRVYRGTDPNDPIGSGSMIGTVTGTSYWDANVLLGTPKAFYVVTATDE